jgi:hypothetical protein
LYFRHTRSEFNDCDWIYGEWITLKLSVTVEIPFKWSKPNHKSYHWNCSCDAICSFPGYDSLQFQTRQHFVGLGLECASCRFWTEYLAGQSWHFFAGSIQSKNQLPSINSSYLAPECYDNQYSQRSYIFSFGLIADELLTDQPAFPKELTKHQIRFEVAIKDERTPIPKFVLLSTWKLRTDWLEKEPGDLPSFKEIMDQFLEMKFNLIFLGKWFHSENSHRIKTYRLLLSFWMFPSAERDW